MSVLKLYYKSQGTKRVEQQKSKAEYTKPCSVPFLSVVNSNNKGLHISYN